MEGILDMCRILMELIAERLKQSPIPIHLLNLLALVLNADANYHTKMKNKRTDPSRWGRVLGEGKVFAVMPHFQTHKDPKGWLVEIMNVVSCQKEWGVWGVGGRVCVCEVVDKLGAMGGGEGGGGL